MNITRTKAIVNKSITYASEKAEQYMEMREENGTILTDKGLTDALKNDDASTLAKRAAFALGTALTPDVSLIGLPIAISQFFSEPKKADSHAIFPSLSEHPKATAVAIMTGSVIADVVDVPVKLADAAASAVTAMVKGVQELME